MMHTVFSLSLYLSQTSIPMETTSKLYQIVLAVFGIGPFSLESPQFGFSQFWLHKGYIWMTGTLNWGFERDGRKLKFSSKAVID